jgi:hypothetical protein
VTDQDAANHSIRIGRPALADAATIDSPGGAVGAMRQLGTSPATANSWNWEVIRRPSGSTAVPSSTSARNPTFTPDVADLFVFRLTASDGMKTSITTVSITATTSGCSIAQPVVTAPALVGENSPNRTASVASHAGSTYAWSITNGTITAGQGTSQITFRAGLQGTLTLSVVETSAAGCVSAAGNATVDVAPAGSALLFYPLYPCRVPGVGPPLAAGEIRTIAPGGSCGIPATAKGLATNATVLAPGAAGHLRFWAAGTAQPPTSTLNFSTGQTRANNALISMPLGASTGFSVANNSTGTTGLIIDISGYFE